MGGLIETQPGYWAAWTGGKPKVADWNDGLDDSAPDTPSPNQLCSAYVSDAQKGYNHRRKGIETPFAKSSDLTAFENTVWDHLVDTGMDTIAYLPDPEASTKMVDVVHTHSRFTVTSAIQHCDARKDDYDPYDHTNERAARTFLLNSLDKTLRETVKEKMEPDDKFAVTWMRLIAVLQSTSIERFEHIKSALRKRCPTDYPGQDICALARAFRYHKPARFDPSKQENAKKTLLSNP